MFILALFSGVRLKSDLAFEYEKSTAGVDFSIGAQNLKSDLAIEHGKYLLGKNEIVLEEIAQYLYFKSKKDVGGLIFKPHPPNFKDLCNFKDN